MATLFGLNQIPGFCLGDYPGQCHDTCVLLKARALSQRFPRIQGLLQSSHRVVVAQPVTLSALRSS